MQLPLNLIILLEKPIFVLVVPMNTVHLQCTAYTVRKGREEISDNEPDLQYQLQTTEPYPLASLCLPYLDFCFFWGGKTTPFPPPCTFHHGISSGLDLID